MNEVMKEKLMTDVSLEVIAKSIIKEAREIGFNKGDYLKLANLILDSAIKIDTGSAPEDKEQTILYDSKRKNKLPLKGENIIVREFKKKTDAEYIHRWMKDDLGRYFILTRANSPHTSAEHLIENENHIIGIISLPDKTPIGLLAFLDYNEEQKKAELRKLIGEPNYRSKGFGKEATKLWIQYGISTLGLNKIYLNTLQTNVRNIRLNQELGFKVEGILRQDCLIDGKYYDVLRMGLVNE